MATIENLEALLAQGRDHALLRYGLGNEYFKQQSFAQASLHLRQAVALDPQYSAAWKLLGQTYAATGDHAQAQQAYEQGIRVAEAKGDVQTAKEMRVFLKRIDKSRGGNQ